jgi:predicted acetyltransferase
MKVNEAEKLRPNIEIIPASLDQKLILANLLELYSHDFCDFVELEIGPDGRFGYKDLDIYWTEPARHPLLVYVDNRLAGFALIDGLARGSPDEIVWDVAEFFVLRGYRRRSVGTEVAHQVWKRFPGRWEVRVIVSNEPAYGFWRHAIESFARHEILATRVTQGGKERYLFSFESRPAAQLPDAAEDKQD